MSNRETVVLQEIDFGSYWFRIVYCQIEKMLDPGFIGAELKHDVLIAGEGTETDYWDGIFVCGTQILGNCFVCFHQGENDSKDVVTGLGNTTWIQDFLSEFTNDGFQPRIEFLEDYESGMFEISFEIFPDPLEYRSQLVNGVIGGKEVVMIPDLKSQRTLREGNQ